MWGLSQTLQREPFCSVEWRAMTVKELMEALDGLPGNAVVLYQGDGGVSLIAGVSLEANVNGMPDEAILHPSMEGD